MSNEKVIESAIVLCKICTKTSNCINCPLFKKTENSFGYCLIAGLSPWEWELDELSNQLEKIGEKE